MFTKRQGIPNEVHHFIQLTRLFTRIVYELVESPSRSSNPTRVLQTAQTVFGIAFVQSSLLANPDAVRPSPWIV